jgi:hypothetical protein
MSNKSTNVYNERFVDNLNSHSFAVKSDFSNEVFLYYYIKLKELESEVSENPVKFLSRQKSFLDKIFIQRAASVILKKRSFFLLLTTPFLFLLLFVSFFFLIFSAFGFLLFCYIKTRRSDHLFINDKHDAFLIRSQAAYQKCAWKIRESTSPLVLYDDFSFACSSGVSIFCLIRTGNILFILNKVLFFSARDFYFLFYDARQMLGLVCALAVLPKFILKICHKAVYEACLVLLIKSSSVSCYFSGDKEDRFALLKTRVISDSGNELVCFPHGLEYGFKFPGGLCGTLFYCYTPEASECLNNIYCCEKFVYSREVVDGMYGLDEKSKDVSKFPRICFFTEPRDPEVNLKIMQGMRDCGVEFCMKLHPLESSTFYKEKFPGIYQLDSLSDALDSSICIARKSTVLLEAMHRGSVAVSVLINSKDRVYADKVFPSLSSKNVFKVHDFDELKKLLSSL